MAATGFLPYGYHFGCPLRSFGRRLAGVGKGWGGVGAVSSGPPGAETSPLWGPRGLARSVVIVLGLSLAPWEERSRCDRRALSVADR